jgi:hypothetical protein
MVFSVICGEIRHPRHVEVTQKQPVYIRGFYSPCTYRIIRRPKSPILSETSYLCLVFTLCRHLWYLRIELNKNVWLFAFVGQ